MKGSVWSDCIDVDYFKDFVAGTGYPKISWEDGITHIDRNGNFWSANFKGWVQNRQLIK